MLVKNGINLLEEGGDLIRTGGKITKTVKATKFLSGQGKSKLSSIELLQTQETTTKQQSK